MPRKTNKTRNKLAELLFWLHTLILLLILVSGLFVDWWWVVLILIIVRAQQIIFHGCLLTLWEVKEGGIKKGSVYFQLAAQRFMGIKIGRTGVHVLFMLHVILTLAVALIAAHYKIRIHL